MSADIRAPKKLIEVALPLDKVNEAAAHEKMPGIGAHPRGIHLWWARRPLAAARAIIFAQLVNDPGYERYLGRGVNKERAKAERDRLFGIIERLVKWENTNNEEILREAREEIRKSWRETCALNKEHPLAKEIFDPERLPAFHDPFAGGGAIPLEAQRLGLEANASDLNPVAVTINKAMLEIPLRFNSSSPVGPQRLSERESRLFSEWEGIQGFAEDVRRYGAWVREQTTKKIGEYYPKIEITKDIAKGRDDLQPLIGEKLTVIAWIWARTVKSPNPAFSHVHVPLASSFVLANKAGKEAFIEPVISGDSYRFEVRLGSIPEAAEEGTKLARGANFKCLLSGVPIEPDYIKNQGAAGKLGARLMAIVAEGKRSRIYISPTAEHEEAAYSVPATWKPDAPIPDDPRNFWIGSYGFRTFGDLFTQRQLLGLNTLADTIGEAVQKCTSDAEASGFAADGVRLEDGGTGALAYGQAIGVYLSFAVDRCADFSNACTRWVPGNQKVMNLFGKQSIAMSWDYPEAAILEDTVGGYLPAVDYIADCMLTLPKSGIPGFVRQEDAQRNSHSSGKVVSTDPPYYDNIAYADLSDFFYSWMKRQLTAVYPRLFTDRAAPKESELVATPYRHGGKEAAERFFLSGMKDALRNLATSAHPAFPITIYYAFKQSETKNSEGTSSTGWETFLEAVLGSGLAIVGTWPMRSEQSSRMIGIGTNALASSIVLVCRRRDSQAPSISRREFIRELNAVLPEALEEMTTGGEHSPVAPVDLSQAIIGPGMAIFSKYSAVLEADGRPMAVKTALQLINRFLAEDDFDHDTQFCLHWFESHGWEAGRFGDADVLARAKGTSVEGLKEGGVVESTAGTLRLLRSGELAEEWNPESDSRISVWEILHQLIKRLNKHGESNAGELLAQASRFTETVRTLAYRLFTLCERKGWAQDASNYNNLVLSWESIEAAAQATGYSGTQISLFGEEGSDQPTVSASKRKTRKKK